MGAGCNTWPRSVSSFFFFIFDACRWIGLVCLLAAKNHKHALNNPYAQFRAGYSEAEVLASTQITNELTKFMCSPTSVERKSLLGL
jgi:hypothetical protein